MRTIYYCFLMCALPSLHYCELVQKPIVDIEMSEAGFHRDLVYTVQFDYPLAGKDCDYMLKQTLPAAVYVSVDQLNDLKRLKKLNAIYPQFVDIEIPTEKAESFTVLIKGIPKITDTITLPINFRYHAPSDKSSFAVVDIPTPDMYMNCPESDDIVDELQQTPSTSYCLQTEGNFKELNINDNDLATISDCNWKLMQVDYQLKRPLRAKVPLGNEKAFPPILYATIILSWAISLWTIYRTHSVPRRINQKLEEQRILQKKIK